MNSKITPAAFRSLKGKKKIVCLTAYDYPLASILDHSGVDLILVGDSLGMVVLGNDSTRNVTMDDMLRATGAARRGVTQALLVADMPFGSFETPEAAIQNARRLLSAGAEAVKMEGYGESIAVTQALLREKIPVMGHLGLTPQTATTFRVQGKTKEAADQMVCEAKALDAAGIFSLVLECIPSSLGDAITKSISIPTIGIGAGAGTDGQILVTYDLLGLYPKRAAKFVRKYADLEKTISQAVAAYKKDVETVQYPAAAESYS